MNNYIPEYHKIYAGLRYQAIKHGLIQQHYKGAYKANLNLYGKRPGAIKLER
jgi:hypothetical protein